MYGTGGAGGGWQALREHPPDGAVLVEYFAVGARLMAFVVRPDSRIPQAHDTDVDPGRVESMAREQVFAAPGGHDQEPGVLDEESTALGSPEWAQVSGALAAPALRCTDPGEVVWFVGHGALHVLPLHAAVLPDGGYLIDRNPVCYTPSATVMRFCRDRQRDLERGGLVVGDPGGDLPHAAAEARAVARVLGSEPLLRDSATRTELLRLLGRGSPSFLHFACHGYFDLLDPMSSGIELSAGDGTGHDQLTARDLLGLEISPSLITLSACRTGLQQRLPGDELLGLARALLYAGTPSAVLTLWNVEDLSTRLLMERFYRALTDGSSLAGALRLAQRYIRSLTAAAAAQGLTEAMTAADGDPSARLALLVALARVQAAARDLAAAADSYAAAIAVAQALPSREDDRFTASLDRTARLLRFKARRASPADYERRPFAHPYYWAPFMLYGDWR